jgi:hypothetical protein
VKVVFETEAKFVIERARVQVPPSAPFLNLISY